MAEFKSVSLADQVFERLQDDIITGVYPRGEILTELKLVEQLGVSRTPIREALRRLEQERLIADSGKGSIVLGITVEDLIDIMDIRQGLEGLAAYHAARNLTPEGLAQLKQIIELQDFYYEKQDINQLRLMDDRFHEAVYTLSGRTILADTLSEMHKKSQRYRKISMEDNTRLDHMISEHRGIFEAIAARDAVQASQKMTKHIEASKKNMLRRSGFNG